MYIQKKSEIWPCFPFGGPHPQQKSFLGIQIVFELLHMRITLLS